MKILNKISNLSAKSLFLGTLIFSMSVVSAKICTAFKDPTESNLQKKCRLTSSIIGKTKVVVNVKLSGLSLYDTTTLFDDDKSKRYIGIRFYKGQNMIQRRRIELIASSNRDLPSQFFYEKKYSFSKDYTFYTSEYDKSEYSIEISSTFALKDIFSLTLDVPSFP